MEDPIDPQPMPPLEEGKPDYVYNKTVGFIVLDTAKFYVFLDSDNEIQWSWNAKEELKTEFGVVLTRAAYLQSLARFANDNDRKQFHRLIAEGLARYLDSSSAKQATEALDIAEREIREKSLKISWHWYFNAAYLLTVFSLILLVVCWIWRTEFRHVLGKTAFDILFAALIGPVGALISVISRGDKITLDANAGIFLHVTEGLARIVAGMCGSALIALAIKGGLIANGLAFKGSSFAAMLTFALVAGASERVVPSLIDRIEGYTVKNSTKKPRT